MARFRFWFWVAVLYSDALDHPKRGKDLRTRGIEGLEELED